MTSDRKFSQETLQAVVDSIMDWRRKAESAVKTGELFAERFQLKSKLGEGGFGVVYEAVDTKSGATAHLDAAGQIPVIALKLIWFRRDQEILGAIPLSDFKGEAVLRWIEETQKMLAVGNIPGCVPFRDCSRISGLKLEEIADKLRTEPLWLAMPVYPQSLSQWLQENGGCLSWEVAVDLMADVAKAMSSLHQKGIIHRDLKPGNILLTDDQKPVVSDYGLSINEHQASLFENDSSGTLEYMAPEQFVGKVSERSDIWSWGVILYQALSGRMPFSSIEATKRSRFQPLNELGLRIPAGLFTLVDGCLRRDSQEINTFSQICDVLKTLSAMAVPSSDYFGYDDFCESLELIARDFIGRDWLFEEIELWALTRHEPALLIQADYGVGKSAFVARMISDERWNRRVLVWHCCRYDEKRTLDPIWFIHNLFTMLCSRCSGFAEQVESRRMQESLMHRRDDPVGAFKELIITVLKTLPPRSEVQFLIVDALDEALGWSAKQQSIVHVLASVADDFPEWLRIVATTRGEPRVLEPLGRLRSCRVDADSDRNVNDLREYAKIRLASPVLLSQIVTINEDVENVARLIVDKAEGKFLYAQLVFQAIERGNLTFREIGQLPSGLPGLYESFFRRHFPTLDSYKGAKDLLQVLVAALETEPLTQRQLAHASGLKRSLPAVLADVVQYLRMRGDLVQFQHASLPQWLMQSSHHSFSLDSREGHLALAAMCQSELQGEETAWSKYMLAHYPTHLINKNDGFDDSWEDVIEVLCTLRFLEAKVECGMVFDLKSDFSKAQVCLPRRHPQRRLIELLDHALGLDIVFLSRHHSSLFQCLWNRCWWYDAPEADAHFEILEQDLRSDHLPRTRSEKSPSKLLETWRQEKELRTPGFCWLRSLRPLEPIGNDANRGDLILSGHTDAVDDVVFIDGGTQICSASRDGTVRVWETATGKESCCFHPDRGPVRCVAVSPNGQWLASGTIKVRFVQLWDMQAGRFVREFQVDGEGESSLSFSPDSDRLIVIIGRRMWCWECRNGVEQWSRTVTQEGGFFVSASLSADSVRFVYMMQRKEPGFPVDVFSVADNRQIAELRGHDEMVRRTALSPNGERLATIDKKTVRIWDLASGKQVASITGLKASVMSLAWSPCGRKLVTGSMDNTVRLWNAATGSEIACLEGHNESVQSVAMSREGGKIASGSFDGIMRVWTEDRKNQPRRLRDHKKRVSRISMSCDGLWLASMSEFDPTVFVWNLQSGLPCEKLLHPESVFQVEWVPNGQHVATSAWDGCIRVWSLKGELLKCWQAHPSGSNKTIGLKLSPDGKHVASWGDSDDRVLWIWDVATGKKKQELSHGKVSDVSFSPDGLQIAAAQNWDGRDARVLHTGLEIGIWDLNNGRKVGRLIAKSDSGVIQRVRFAPDGKRIAAAIQSDIVIWDATSGNQLLRLRGSDGPVQDFAFSKDGGRIISNAKFDRFGGVGNTAGTTAVWDVTKRAPPRKIPGMADVRAIAADQSWYPIQWVLESAVIAGTSNTAIAFMPCRVEHSESNLERRIWAAATDKTVVLHKLEGTLIQGTDVVCNVSTGPENAEISSASRQARRKDRGGPFWHDDERVLHEAVCPVCGDGGICGSGNYSTELRVFFEAGSQKSFERRIEKMQIRCLGPAVHAADGDSKFCNVGTGEGLLRMLPHSHPEWNRERVREYLRAIRSPFATHPSLDQIPTRQDLRSYCEWPAVLNSCIELARPETASNTVATPFNETALSGAALPESQTTSRLKKNAFAGSLKAFQKLLTRSNNPALYAPRKGAITLELHGHEGAVCAAHFVEENHTVWSVGYDGTVRIWDLATGREMSRIVGHDSIVCRLAVSSNGLCVATASWDHTIGLWNTSDGQLQNRLRGHSNFVYDVAFTSDGEFLASASEDRTVRLWEVRTGRMVGCLHGHASNVNCVAFSHDRALIVSGSSDRTVRTWELPSAIEQEPYYGHSKRVTRVCFSPDGTMIASASDDGTVHMRSVRSNEIKVLRGHEGMLLALAYSHDGQFIATGGDGGIIRIWHVPTAREVIALNGHEKGVHSIAFSADDRKLLSATEDGGIKLWEIDWTIFNER